MIKRIVVSALVMLIVLLISACTAKLTTIRPTLITRIDVENLETGAKAELLRGAFDETDWLMDDLVFQMEQQFRQEGKCSENDNHRYHAIFYFKDRLELDVRINGDGSVCRGGRRYAQANNEKARSTAR